MGCGTEAYGAIVPREPQSQGVDVSSFLESTRVINVRACFLYSMHV